MSKKIKIIDLSYVDENGDVYVYYPKTDIQAVDGLVEVFEDIMKIEPLQLRCGTMQGDINMNGHSVLNLPEPKNSGDPVTRGYMETYINNTFLGGVW